MAAVEWSTVVKWSHSRDSRTHPSVRLHTDNDSHSPTAHTCSPRHTHSSDTRSVDDCMILECQMRLQVVMLIVVVGQVLTGEADGWTLACERANCWQPSHDHVVGGERRSRCLRVCVFEGSSTLLEVGTRLAQTRLIMQHSNRVIEGRRSDILDFL